MLSHRLWPSVAVTFGLLASVAEGHEGDTEVIEELVVYGRAEPQIGIATSASAGFVGYDDIKLPPLLRAGELVEAVPGMVATQHSGTGKANQYFLRGFNLDHGTDFAASAEGVPLNMRTHGHGQGYLDLNFLIPELVASTTFRKGPYAARAGDFSSAGSVEFSFYERLEEALLGGTIGGDDYYRALAAGSLDAPGGVVTAALDLGAYAGPWVLDEDLSQKKLFASYAFDAGGVPAKITFQGYDADWNSTDQIPERAVEAGLIDPFGFVDPDLGGQTERYLLTGSLDFGAWQVSGYALDYDFTLFSNFTYFLDDPEMGDEFEQRDRRRVYGAEVKGAMEYEIAGRTLALGWGGSARADDIAEVGLYGTAGRARTDIVRQDAVEEWSLGAWGEAELAVTDRLRAIAGLRLDYFDWQVGAFRAVNSGSGSDSLLSPKASVAYRLRDDLEGYLNWGTGFHSNDVRGATITIDPVSGDPVDRVGVLVESEGSEIGLRYERGEDFNISLALFRLELDSELVFVGDAGTTEPNDATERTGIELSTFWQAADWLAVNAAYTATDAEFKIDQGGGREIPCAIESTFTLGLNAAWRNGFTASARVRYLGEAPLIEDDSVRADGSLLVNAGIAWRREQLELRLDAFNLFDSSDDDISYFYASRLPGEPSNGIDDRHFHPLEPRTLRASVTWHWR
jgi:outer membrane receptor protein involved in Fe transport